MKAIVVREFGGPEVSAARRRARSGARSPIRWSCASARSASIRWTPTSAAARTRASRRCRTSRARTRPARSKPSARTSKTVDAGDRVYIHGTAAEHTHGHYGGAYAEKAVCRLDHSLHAAADRSRSRRARRWACPTPRRIARCSIAPHARPGETVLVHGATGGVGLAAVQIAHAHGMHGHRHRRHRPRAGGRPRARRGPRRSTTRTPGYLDADHEGDRRTRRRRRPRDGRARQPRQRSRRCSPSAAASSSSAAAAASRSTRGRRWARRRDPGHDALQHQRPRLASINAHMVAGLANGTLNPVVGREFPLADAARARSRDGGRRARQNRPRSLTGTLDMAETDRLAAAALRTRRRGRPLVLLAARRHRPRRRHDALLLRRRALVRLARLRRRLLEDAQPAGGGLRGVRRRHLRRALRRVPRAEAGAPRRAHRRPRSSSTDSRCSCRSSRCCGSSRSASSLVIAVVTGAGMMAEWPTFALYWYAPAPAPAAVVDPIFGRPITFYLFTLPALAAHRRLADDAGA